MPRTKPGSAPPPRDDEFLPGDKLLVGGGIYLSRDIASYLFEEDPNLVILYGAIMLNSGNIGDEDPRGPFDLDALREKTGFGRDKVYRLRARLSEMGILDKKTKRDSDGKIKEHSWRVVGTGCSIGDAMILAQNPEYQEFCTRFYSHTSAQTPRLPDSGSMAPPPSSDSPLKGGSSSGGIESDTHTQSKSITSRSKKGKIPGIFLDLSDQLAEIVQGKMDVKIPRSRRIQWAKEIRMLQSRDGIEPIRMQKAVDWYQDHAGLKFCPVIESGRSFREKFLRLESQMKQDRAVRAKKRVFDIHLGREVELEEEEQIDS